MATLAGKSNDPQMDNLTPAQANQRAIGTAVFVCEEIRRGRNSELIYKLATDLFLRVGEISQTRLQRLSKFGSELLSMPAFQELMEQLNKEQRTPELRNLIQTLTPGRVGRRPSIDHDRRLEKIRATLGEFEGHIEAIHRMRNPRQYFLTWKDTRLGKRISSAGLAEQ